jgi:quinoprotein glucose dehydrogenase
MHLGRRSVSVVVATLAVCGSVLPALGSREWPAYGGGPESTRYSPLDQVNRSNVHHLEVAWTYDTGETGGFQVNPIVVNGVLYANTPRHRVIALDAATGAAIWTFDAKLESRGPNRGVSYWASGDDRRIFAAVDHYLYALNARTGMPVAAFGESGRLDLRKDLGRDPSVQSVQLTTPPIVYKDLLIIGGRVGEGVGASPGDIRAYDAKSGALRWTFHTIPPPGAFGHDTWSKDSWMVNGGANNWAGMALDAARGIVFVPTGSAAPDFYGGDRVGDNLFANCLLALNADTGKRIWHYQMVRHDIWDRDPPSSPTLVTVTRGGVRVDAVAQTTKHGYVFLFERTTGKPLFPIEERAFPASAVPGETTAATQPIPAKPLPFARQLLTSELLTRRTPEAHAWALAAFQKFRSNGQFVPLAVGADTVVFPGFDGGAEWGGSAYDPAKGVLFVNSNDLAWTGGLAVQEAPTSGRAVYLKECALCHLDSLAGAPPTIPTLVGIRERRTPDELTTVIRKGAGRMPGFPQLSDEAVEGLVEYMRSGRDRDLHESAARAASYRFTGYKRFMDPDGYPAVAPPWGTLNAIDLNTGEYAWKIPLGEHPELTAKGLKETGSENYGGPIVTAGGLVFIAATSFDKKFRAFDKDTGKLLWETTLPFAGNATPATYEVNGRQFIVVPAGGGKSKDPSGGVYVAFALSRALDNSGFRIPDSEYAFRFRILIP